MFGIGETELVLILLFGFLMFGPDKLPGMGKTIGRALRQFRTAQDGVTKVVQSEIIDPISKGADADMSSSIEDELDADIDVSKKETFAQKKARLAAEAAAEKTAEVSSSEEDVMSQEEASSKPEPAPAPTSEPDPEPEISTSAASLYGLTTTAAPAVVAAKKDASDSVKEEGDE
ncbi:twin-arginine translocase TatA/TatE family subunit [Atopobium fossor]|uniref:twin-arginine translocase TatA/TatE family subunit n=1 Tax=Atopobium fossor TaxID=39487 RepID=UPI0004051005|nr:twin-arginine translocase TatA/TatE family subunit [Atopobium fossor]